MDKIKENADHPGMIESSSDPCQPERVENNGQEMVSRDFNHLFENLGVTREEDALRTNMLNSFTEIIAFYAPDHRIKWLNNAAKKQLGIKDNSYIDKLCYNVWYGSEAPCSKCPAVSQHREPVDRITTRNDSRSWLVRHTPLISKNGVIQGYIEYSKDITEQLKLETGIKQAQQRLQKAEIVASLAHFEHDFSTGLKIWSPAAGRLFSLPYSKIVKGNIEFTKFVHPHDYQRIDSALKEAVSGRTVFDQVFLIKDICGEEKTVHGIGQIEINPSDHSKKFFATVQDITYLLKLKSKIAEEEDKYKKLADNAPVGIGIGNSRELIYCNKALLQISGYQSLHEIVQEGISGLIHPNDLRLITGWHEKKETGRMIIPSRLTLRIITKDKDIRFLSIYITDCTIDDHQYFQAIVLDITNEKEQERLRKQLAADSLYINQKNKITLEIRSELDKILGKNKKYSKRTFQKIYDIIHSYTRLDDDWDLLIKHFEQIHPDFFRHLEHQFPHLSVSDIKHCACMKLNFDTKETARFFNVKPESVKMSRVRLKRKFGLSKTTDLRNFILNY